MHIEELYQAVSNMAVVAQHLKEDAENLKKDENYKSDRRC